MLPLAKQSLDEVPYKLSEAIAKLVSITFSRLSLSYWIDNLGFITEGKLAAIFIKTFSWGFPTGQSFYFINSAPPSFLAPLLGRKKTSARGVSHAHPLLCFKFCFTLFLLASFYQKPKKKLESFVVVFTCLLLVC
jgi:hypothetical protein